MSDPDDRSPANDAHGQAPSEAPEARGEGVATGSEPPVEDALAAAKTEAARMRDQLLRTAADFDNYRKRSRKELEDSYSRGRETVIKDLLPVFDNLERATAHAEDTKDAKSMADGLRIVLKQFIDTLERIGVTRVATVGAPFDPSVHEAIQHLASAEHAPGVVVAEVQPGYKMGNHLVRAAMVVVSKGPPNDDAAS